MQYIPCNGALLAQETLFLTQKGTFFAQRSPKSVKIATNLNLRQNSVCSGLKFSSKSKLFSGCHPCSSATSVTLSGNICGPFAAESIGAYRIRSPVGSLMIFAPIALIEKIWIHLHGDLLIVCVPIYKR